MQQQLKKRPCKNCGEKFQKKTSLQYLCSPKCEKEWREVKRLIKESAFKEPVDYKLVGFKKQAPIRKVSVKRAGELKDYSKLKKEFMSRPENQFCPVMKHFQAVDMPATEIHHINDRNGDRLNDTNYWLAVTRVGHTWIHSNPKEARKLKWLI
jgi:hypothetical protein